MVQEHQPVLLPLVAMRIDLGLTEGTKATSAGDRFHSRFDATFRRLVCTTGSNDCAACMLDSVCPYTVMSGVRPGARTHPLIGNGQQTQSGVIPALPWGLNGIEQDRRIEAGLTLVGRAADFLPYVILALERMGDRTALKSGGPYWPFDLVSVRQIGPSGRARTIWHAGAKQLTNVTPAQPLALRKPSRPMDLRLEMASPLALKVKGRITAEAPSLGTLMRALVRRAAGLAAAYTDLPLLEGYEPLFELADRVATRASGVRMQRWKRESRSQGQQVPMMGLMGWVEYEKVPPQLVPWLRLGEVLHVGKGTAFGLGQYQLAD